MAVWLKARAVLHDRSVSAEGRSVVNFAMQAENMLGKTDVAFVTALAQGAA